MSRLREVALQFGPLSRTQRGGVHYAEGDMILEREPVGRIGSQEARSFVWVLVEFPDEMPPIQAHVDAQERPIAKARFHLSVGELHKVFPAFEVSRARDPEDVYQPFLPVVQQPEGDYVFQPPTVTLKAHGRLFDKQEGRTR